MVQADPYQILGLKRNASDRDIKKKCKDLKLKHHPDKGGNTDDFIRINGACESLDPRLREERPHGYAENFWQKQPREPGECTSWLKECSCSNGKKGVCAFTENFDLHCLCFEEASEPKSTEQGFSWQNQKRQKPVENFDGCMQENDACICSNTYLSGTCIRGPVKEGLYCDCEKKSWETFESRESADSSQESNFSGQFDWESEFTYEEKFKTFRPFSKYFEEHKYAFEYHIFSRTVQSPLYRLGVERSMDVLYEIDNGCHKAFFSYATFIRLPKGHAEENLYKHEGGILFGFRYAGKSLYVDLKTLFSSRKQTFDKPLHSSLSESIGFRDFLLAIGGRYESDASQWSLQALVGNSPSSKRGSRYEESTAFVEATHPSAGLQGNLLIKLSENEKMKSSLITNMRWLHFFANEIPFLAKDNATVIGHFKAHPGGFIDLLVGFDTYLGRDYQHRFEIGYNPTFRLETSHLIPEKQRVVFEDKDFELTVNYEPAPFLQNNVYITYHYTIVLGDIPISLGIGYMKTFISDKQKSALEHEGASLFWTTFALAF